MMPWELARMHWVYCDMDTRNIDEPFDLRDYEGVEFYIKGNRDGRSLRFALFTQNGNDDDRKEYQYICDILTNTYWQKKKIMFSELSLPYWNKDKGGPAHPSLNRTFAFGFSTDR